MRQNDEKPLPSNKMDFNKINYEVINWKKSNHFMFMPLSLDFFKKINYCQLYFDNFHY